MSILYLLVCERKLENAFQGPDELAVLFFGADGDAQGLGKSVFLDRPGDDPFFWRASKTIWLSLCEVDEDEIGEGREIKEAQFSDRLRTDIPSRPR